jgi:hypothetical protein
VRAIYRVRSSPRLPWISRGHRRLFRDVDGRRFSGQRPNSIGFAHAGYPHAYAYNGTPHPLRACRIRSWRACLLRGGAEPSTMVDGRTAIRLMGHWTSSRALPDYEPQIATMVLHHDVSVSRRLQHLLGLRLLRCFFSVEIVNGGSDAGLHPVLSMAGDRPSALALLRHSSGPSQRWKWVLGAL